MLLGIARHAENLRGVADIVCFFVVHQRDLNSAPCLSAECVVNDIFEREDPATGILFLILEMLKVSLDSKLLAEWLWADRLGLVVG